mgnify:CR=1 FL=1
MNGLCFSVAFLLDTYNILNNLNSKTVHDRIPLFINRAVCWFLISPQSVRNIKTVSINVTRSIIVTLSVIICLCLYLPSAVHFSLDL